MLLVVYDTDPSVNGIYQHNVMLHLISVSLPRNVMVPIIVLSRPLAVNATVDANGIT